MGREAVGVFHSPAPHWVGDGFPRVRCFRMTGWASS